MGLSTEKHNKYPSFIEACVLLVLFIALQMIFGFIIALTGIVAGLGEDSPVIFILNLYIIPIVTGTLVILYGLRKANSRWSELLGEKTRSIIPYLHVLIMFVGLSLVMSEIDNYVRHFYPMTDFWKGIFQNIYQANIWLSFFGIAVIPPILEETLFRGVILKGFLHRYSNWFAIALSSLLFAVIHLNVWQFTTALIAGFFLGWIFYKTGSLIIVIFAHAVINAIAVLGNHYTSIPGFTDGAPFQPAWLTLVGLGLVIISLMLFNLPKTYKKTTSNISAR